MTENKYLAGYPLFISTIAIALATFLIVLDYSIANISIPYIAGDLGVSTNEGTYVITSFAVGSAIVLAITGWLTKKFGIIRLTCYSLFGFVIFSLICGIAPDMTTLVLARFAQGLCAGPLVPLSQTLIISIFPPAKKTLALGFWSSVVIVAPILGPILGGWISYDIHWPWIFFINIPLGLFSIFVIQRHLKPFETAPEKPPTDLVGLILLVIGVSTLQFLLDKGDQFDWYRSPLILSCMIISFLSFLYLVIWELYHPTPVLELRLLKIPSYNLSIIYIATMYSIYFGSVVLVPLWLQEYMNYTPIWAGVAVSTIGIAPFLFTGIINMIVNKYGHLVPIGLSLVFFAISSFDGAYFNTDVDLFHISFSRFLFGFGLLFFVVPLFSLSVRDIPQHQLPSATGMFHFVRAMMGGVGTSLFTTLWTHRTIFHHANIAAEINSSRTPVNAFYSKLDSLGISGEKAQTLINEMADKQAAVLGINDSFFLMGWIFIALIAILLLGRKKKSQQHEIT